MSGNDILHENVVALAGARQTHADLKAKLDAARAAFDEANAALITQVKAAKEAETTAYKSLAAEAEEVFEATGEKNVHLGVSVMLKTAYHYDEAAAIQWCQANFPAALETLLNKKVYEQFLKVARQDKTTWVALQQPPGDVIATSKARIKTDLSEYATPPAWLSADQPGSDPAAAGEGVTA